MARKPDGVLGQATFAQLSRPLSFRVRQIELTMERWRWLPTELDSAPIIVNIPQFRLFAFESTSDSEASIRQMDVIVGRAFHATQTPVFSADMTYVVFRPYWDVPYSIARKEIVPAARRDLACIERHQMEIVRGCGDAATVMPNTAGKHRTLAKGALRVRQRPGSEQFPGVGQIHAAESLQRVFARHAGSGAVPRIAARFQPRLHTRQRSRGACAVCVARFAGMDPREDLWRP